MRIVTCSGRGGLHVLHAMRRVARGWRLVLHPLRRQGRAARVGGPASGDGGQVPAAGSCAGVAPEVPVGETLVTRPVSVCVTEPVTVLPKVGAPAPAAPESAAAPEPAPVPESPAPSHLLSPGRSRSASARSPNSLRRIPRPAGPRARLCSRTRERGLRSGAQAPQARPRQHRRHRHPGRGTHRRRGSRRRAVRGAMANAAPN